jgi:hypothetical protein
MGGQCRLHPRINTSKFEVYGFQIRFLIIEAGANATGNVEVVDPEVSFVVSALIQMQFTPAAVHW